MAKYLDSSGLAYLWTQIKAKFSIIGHVHTIPTSTATTIGTWSAGSTTAGSAASLSTTTYTIPNVTSAGSVPSLTTNSASVVTGVTKKTVVTGVTKKTVVTSVTPNTPTSASIADGILTITDGTACDSATGDSVTVTTGDSVTVTTGTVKEVDEFNAGAAPTLGTAFSVKGVNSWTANTPTAVTLPTLTTAQSTVLSGSTTGGSTN